MWITNHQAPYLSSSCMDWGQPTNLGSTNPSFTRGWFSSYRPGCPRVWEIELSRRRGIDPNFCRRYPGITRKFEHLQSACGWYLHGRAIALQLTLEHPEIVENLVLINTFATLRPERPGVWLYYAGRFLMIHTLGLDVQSRVVARRIFPREDQESLRKILIGQICQANLKGYRATMRALARFEVTTRLGNIRQPTFVITGSKDTTVTPTNQRKLAQGIPHARQVFIEGGGHAIIAEQPELVNNYLVEFLRS